MAGRGAPRARTRTRLARLANEVAAASIGTPGQAPRAASATAGNGAAANGGARRSVRVRRGPPLPAPLIILIVLAGVLATGLGVQRITGTAILPHWMTRANMPGPHGSAGLKASRPVRIIIPSLQVRADVHNVGLAPDGSIAVPSLDRTDEAGWYDKSPTPGQYGPAVIVGHVDTRTGPSIFYNLRELRPGDQIRVGRRDRSVAVFEVNSVERFDKANLPTQRIYGDYTRPGLRLITCGGRWVGGETGYADNIVVFASLVQTRRS